MFLTRMNNWKKAIGRERKNFINLFHGSIDSRCHGAKKIAILIRMQFLNDIIKSRHGFKTAQKFHTFRVFIP